MNTQNALEIVSAAVLLAGVVSGGWVLARFRGLSSAMDLLHRANTELRAQVEDLRTKQDDLRQQHAREVGELQGQIDALTGGLAERIVQAVVTHAKEIISET